MVVETIRGVMSMRHGSAEVHARYRYNPESKTRRREEEDNGGKQEERCEGVGMLKRLNPVS